MDAYDPSRVFMRDALSYCAILLDNNNRRTIARLHFNKAHNKQVELFDKSESERIGINVVSDIHGMTPRLIATIEKLGGSNAESK